MQERPFVVFFVSDGARRYVQNSGPVVLTPHLYLALHFDRRGALDLRDRLARHGRRGGRIYDSREHERTDEDPPRVPR